MTTCNTREFYFKDFSNREAGLLKLYKALRGCLAEDYACAVSVDPMIKKNSYSPIAIINKISGIEMEELFVASGKEINVTTFGNPICEFPIKKVSQRVEFERLYYMKVTYNFLNRNEINEIETRVNSQI